MRPKPLVLIVDDEEVFLEIASVKLNADGFETATAQNATDALAFFTSLYDPLRELQGDRRAVLAELGNTTFLSKTDDVGVLTDKISQLLRAPHS